MTKRGEERGEQTRVINFHIVWIMENVSLSWKNYTDLSPARNALWIVRGNIVLMNATTRRISSPKTTRPQGSEDSCKTRWKYIFLLKKYAPASSREISSGRRSTFPIFVSPLSFLSFFPRNNESNLSTSRNYEGGNIFHFFFLLFFFSRKIRGRDSKRHSTV